MPPHEVYIETHLGGGAIIRKKKPPAAQADLRRKAVRAVERGMSQVDAARLITDRTPDQLRLPFYLRNDTTLVGNHRTKRPPRKPLSTLERSARNLLGFKLSAIRPLRESGVKGLMY
jgi:hypothetical protein